MARTYVIFEEPEDSDYWIVPEDVTELTIVCTGAGGNGGFGDSPHGGVAGNGGGGGASSKTVLTVTPGDSFMYYVGRPGDDDYADTFVTTAAMPMPSDALCYAEGGFSNGSGIGGRDSEGIGDYKVSGGQGETSGDGSNGTGGGGAGSCSAIDGDEDYTEVGHDASGSTGGSGAITYDGTTGAGGNGSAAFSDVAGQDGGTPGGGGGGTGATTGFSVAGGAGGPGRVEFSYAGEDEGEEGPGYGGGSGTKNHAFFTFRNLPIPIRATINKAFITLTTHDDNDGIWSGNNNDTLNAVICGHLIDSSTAPDDWEEAIDLPRTVTQKEWNDVDKWDDTGDTHDTPDISCVVQEIIDREGWESGNDITIFIETNYKTGSEGSVTRISQDYGTEPSGAAQLNLYFSLDEFGDGGVVCGGSSAMYVTTPAQGGVVCGGLSLVSISTIDGNFAEVTITDTLDDGWFGLVEMISDGGGFETNEIKLGNE